MENKGAVEKSVLVPEIARKMEEMGVNWAISLSFSGESSRGALSCGVSESDVL